MGRHRRGQVRQGRNRDGWRPGNELIRESEPSKGNLREVQKSDLRRMEGE